MSCSSSCSVTIIFVDRMYFYKELSHRLDLEPKDFDNKLEEKNRAKASATD